MQQNFVRRTKPARKLKYIIVLLACLAIVAAGLVVSGVFTSEERAAYNASRNVFLDNISVNGIDISGMMYNDAWNAVMEQAAKAQNTWSLDIACNGFTYSTVSYANIGISTDYAMLEQLLIEAWQYGHGTFEQYKKDVAALREHPYEGMLSQTAGQHEYVDYILNIIAENVSRAPQNACLLGFDASNPADPFIIQPGVEGCSLDVEAACAEIFRRAYAGEGGVYNVPLTVVAPAVSTQDIENSVSLLAEGKNAIDKHSTKERNTNIELAFSKINGLVLEDGKTFSFNNTVGARTEKAGFLPAIGYVSGELAEVIGGGVCQASTTLYSAALCAGLTIVDRTPHSMPVSYINLGQDAAVNYVKGHMIDLKFKNETGAPVYITAAIESNESGRLMTVVRVFGAAHPDGIHYRVQSVEVETLPIPETVDVRKDTKGTYVKYTDQTYIASKGSEGHVVQTYLQKLDGTSVVEEMLISTDTYKAKPVVQYVGVTKRN